MITCTYVEFMLDVHIDYISKSVAAHSWCCCVQTELKQKCCLFQSSIFQAIVGRFRQTVRGSKVPKWCLVFLDVILWLDCSCLKSKPFIDEQRALQSKEKLSGVMCHTFILLPSFNHMCIASS